VESRQKGHHHSSSRGTTQDPVDGPVGRRIASIDYYRQALELDPDYALQSVRRALTLDLELP